MILARLLDALRHRSQRRLVKNQLPPFGTPLQQRIIQDGPHLELDIPGERFRIATPGKIVQSGDFRPQLDQCDCQMRADKTGPAGDEDCASLEGRAVQPLPIGVPCHGWIGSIDSTLDKYIRRLPTVLYFH